jgi:hypothetical protein
VYKLWNPEVHGRFGPNFSGAVHAMLVAQRRYPVGKLPDECLYYIMNLCKWDWFDDASEQMKMKHRTRKRKAADVTAATVVLPSPIKASSSSDIDAVTTMTTAVVAVADATDPDLPTIQAALHHDREAYERFHGYRADDRVFRLDEAVSSDEDDSDNDAPHVAGGGDGQHQRGWFRRQFARINVLRYHNHQAAANDDEDDDEHVDDDDENDSDDEDFKEEEEEDDSDDNNSTVSE